MTGKRVLIIEDDVKLAALTAEYLQDNGLEVDLYHSGEGAVERVLSTRPDVVILDIMLPVKEGTVICSELRDRYSGGILMLTARDDDMDELLGLELGADDYVAKPVKPRLLLARIHSLLRRLEGNGFAGLQLIELGMLRIDLAAREVFADASLLDLTDSEFDLLHLLARHSGQVVTRDQMLREIRGFEYNGMDRSIDNRVSRLRRKLPPAAAVIKTVRSKGYLLVAPPAANGGG
ncbi:MAG TPA: response regulator transcription factor [Gammaproteobacteria bacterium]|nr:response regulator transcription factor [Gammaproteobacteria bacterium]